MFRDFTRILEQTRKRLSVCKYIRLVDPVKGKNGVFDYDRSKLVFSTRASLLSGSDLYHILLDRYHIQMEMESENYALAIAAVGDREEGFERLCQAIEELDQEQADLIKAGIPAEENKKLDTRSMHFVLTQMMSMADAMEAPTEKCPLEESIGRISAEFAYLYPPGIPLITPGEQITGQFIRNMRIYMDKRQTIDLYGKFHKGLELEQTQFYTSKEQKAQGYGADVLCSPVKGKVIKMADVPDPVFGGEVLGKGCAVWPEDDLVYAPCDGKVTVTMGHAVGLQSDSGIEVLVHVGVDTVNMNGDGFEGFVKADDVVKAGQPLLKIDRAKIAAAGYKDCVVVAVSNTAEFADVELAVEADSAVAAGDAIVKVVRK